MLRWIRKHWYLPVAVLALSALTIPVLSNESPRPLSDVVAEVGLSNDDVVAIRDTPMTPAEAESLRADLAQSRETRQQIQRILGERSITEALFGASAEATPEPSLEQTSLREGAGGDVSLRAETEQPAEPNWERALPESLGGDTEQDEAERRYDPRVRANGRDVESLPDAQTPDHPFFDSMHGLRPKDHPLIHQAIAFYTTEGRESLLAAFSRLEMYFPVVRKQLDAQNVPLELAAVPMLLAAYHHDFRNHLDHRGLFALDRHVAQRYGLRMNDVIDERLDLERGVDAGVRHLRRTFQVLHDWDATLAASQASLAWVREYLATRAMGGVWSVIDEPEFRERTRDFVPRFYAILTILANPQSYEFPTINWNAEFDWDSVPFPYAMNLRQVGQAMGLGAHILAVYNPQFLREQIPSNLDYIELKVPEGTAALLSEAMQDVLSGRTPSQSPSQRSTLEQLEASQPLGMRIEAERLRHNEEVRRQQRLAEEMSSPERSPLLPDRTLSDSVAERAEAIRSTEQAAPATPARTPQVVVHTVSSGETLSGIARRYGISVTELAEANQIDNPNAVRVGQQLRIPGERAISAERATPPLTASPVDSPVRDALVVYEVKEGDSLVRIAREHGISVTSLVEANDGVSHVIRVGQRLQIPIAQAAE